MMKVTVYKQEQEVGTIQLSRGKLKVAGDKSVVNIAREPIRVEIYGRVHEIGPDQPEVFLKMLHKHYHSAYLWVSRAI